MIIYIAGKITGDFNYKQKFAKAERYLRSLGHIVINPARLPQGLRDYMPVCKALIDQSDGVYFLIDWRDSDGAREEYDHSLFRGKKLFFEEEPEEIPQKAEYWKVKAISAEAELAKIKAKINNAVQKAGVK